MSLPPVPVVFAGLILLFLLTLPLGATLLRAVEWFLGRTLRLSVLERLLLSFYATGGLYFAVASLPVPILGLPLVAATLIMGGVGYVVLSARNGWTGATSVHRFFTSRAGLVVLVASLLLLYLEVSAGAVLLPNGIDGAMDALFTNLIVTNHSVPWTLEPYAPAGVIYPQGAPVWMTLPVFLYSWPVVGSPIVLPPLFLSLTIPAAYALGERLHVIRSRRTEWSGLLFAGFFGLVASWPRLYVAGSYDFIFALPLLLMGLAFVRDFWRSNNPSYREAAALGVFLGAILSLSAAVGLVLVLLALAYLVMAPPNAILSFRKRISQLVVAVSISTIFVLRSFIGIALWFGYPGHILTPTGSPPYAPPGPTAYSGWMAQVNPFQPFKWKVSPIPFLSVEIQLLLIGGVILAALLNTRWRERVGEWLPRDVGQTIALGTAVLLGLTSALAFMDAASPSSGLVPGITNLWETSIQLFVFYELLAVLPLAAAANYLSARVPERGATSLPPRRRHTRFTLGRAPAQSWPTVAAVALLAIPLSSGLAGTIISAPPYLHSYILLQANVTQGDLAALEWAGVHLPPCSAVIVAPGSAGSFLPEFGVVQLMYPPMPSPANYSYYLIITDLTQGAYTPATRAALEQIGATEVFVTGATTNAKPPIQATPLLTSIDFSLLFHAGDAEIFGFNFGIQARNCAPT